MSVMPSHENVMGEGALCDQGGGDLAARLSGWVLGREPRQRLWVKRMGVSTGMYLATIVLQCWAIEAGLLSRAVGMWLVAYELTGFGLLYALLRSGLSRRLPDPSMAFWQTMLGLSVVVLNYALFEASRDVAMPLLCLTLVFGLYVLSPAQILLATGCAVAMLLVMLFFMSRLNLPHFDVEQQALNVALAAITLPVLAIVARQVALMRRRQVRQQLELDQAIQQLNEVATRDGLTGLSNRRHMNARLSTEVQRMARSQRAFSLLILDIDCFKRINDLYGHQVGDQVLVAFGRQILSVFGDPDAACRWGGEEFLVLMPETSAMQAQDAARCLQTSMNIELPDIDHGRRARVTFSGGIAQAEMGEPLANVIARADAALYQAKRGGRNRVLAAPAS